MIIEAVINRINCFTIGIRLENIKKINPSVVRASISVIFVFMFSLISLFLKRKIQPPIDNKTNQRIYKSGFNVYPSKGVYNIIYVHFENLNSF